jgi:hypothetical protein
MLYAILFTTFITIVLAGLIAGSTFYITLVEVPARSAMNANVSAGSWMETFPRAMKSMKAMGFVLLALLVITFLLTWNFLWLIAIIPFFALGPYTGARMAPINNQLLDEALDLNSQAAHDLTTEWGKRHAIRTYMALSGFAIVVIAGLT